MADGNSTGAPALRAVENSEDLKRNITRLANDLEHTCDAMSRLAAMSQQMNGAQSEPDRELAAMLWAIDKLGLYSIGVCGAIARRVGGLEVGHSEEELREIAPSTGARGAA